MLEKIIQIFKIRDLRKKILCVFLLLVVFRIAAHIPIPGVDREALRQFFAGNQIFGLLSMFTGGAMENLSIVMLGVGPYITASIIMQLLAMVIPAVERLAKEEGEAGRQKINQYTRYLSVPLAALQSYAMIITFNRAQQPVITDLSLFNLASTIITITAGTLFLMWIGELITEFGIGNGVSLIIFAGIVAGVPMAIQQTFAVFDPSQIFNIALFGALAIIVIAGVVFVTEAQRNIPVSYARRVRGMKMYGGTSTHLPLRVNTAGVIPIIFAISIMLFPGMIASFFANSNTAWVADLAQRITNLFQNQLFYGILYFTMVFLFTYFYTSVVFDPKNISENVQKSGGFIPGIRPGRPTAEYLHKVMNRITLVGGIFLGLIAVMPLLAQSLSSVQTMVLGGTGLLIVVSVVLETMKQIESQMVMRDYEGF